MSHEKKHLSDNESIFTINISIATASVLLFGLPGDVNCPSQLNWDEMSGFYH